MSRERAKTCPRRTASSAAVLHFVQSWVTRMESLQEAIEKVNWARFRAVSVMMLERVMGQK